MAKTDNKDFEAQLLSGSTPASADGSKKLMVDILHEKFGADASSQRSVTEQTAPTCNCPKL